MMNEVRLALFEPDIAPNVGTIIRMGACMAVPIDIIEPCGFAFSLHSVRRQVLDYGSKADIARHDSWAAFQACRPRGRLIAMSTKGATPLHSFHFDRGDTILMGRESAGLPDAIIAEVNATVFIPMAPGTRSLNVAIAAGMAVSEAIRQLKGARTTDS